MSSSLTRSVRSETGHMKLLQDNVAGHPISDASSQSIHSNNGPQNTQEPLQDEQKHEDMEPEPPKMWDLDDPFLYGPPKPDRDPWGILLEPLLKKDKMQCDAWKEEVQNLLIFAGLFSAVVTAFIIESYKSLKPDPNDAIISLLSLIANRLDNTTNSMIPVFIPSTAPVLSFSPKASSIRLNNFWFISLILSLGTVLVGIISLQWIREHQNYPNLSPKESFALFNMRADGLKKWHVPKIFTALPLLLQSALVLFLGGIIDFLFAFGDNAVAIPVSIAIVLVILFLIITTILPTFQIVLLYLPYPYARTNKIPPAQCPYKSPQAHAFRAILNMTMRLLRNISHDKARFYTLEFKIIDFATYVWFTWTRQTWTEFDVAWLQVRDRFVQTSHGHFIKRWLNYVDRNLPVFDLVQALLKMVDNRDTDLIPNSLSAQYHCFAEVSTWITNPDIEPCVFPESYPQAILETNAYLLDVMTHCGVPYSPSLSTFFNLNKRLGYLELDRSISRISKLLHQENMLFFLQTLELSRDFHAFGTAFKLKDHLLELTMRLSTTVHTEEYNLDATAVWPSFFSFSYHSIMIYSVHSADYNSFFWQWVNNFSTFFQNAARVQRPYVRGATMHTYAGTAGYVHAAARVGLQDTFSAADGLQPLIQRKFLDTFQLITENLNKELASPDFREPSLLFYLTALYLCVITESYDRHACLDDLLSVMHTYKERTIDAGVRNQTLEAIYCEPDPIHELMALATARFSPEWWNLLKNSRTGASGSSISVRSHPSTEQAIQPDM